MINVLTSINLPKPKPFPKLMKSELGQIIYAVLENEDHLTGFLIESNGYAAGRFGFSESWDKRAFETGSNFRRLNRMDS